MQKAALDERGLSVANRAMCDRAKSKRKSFSYKLEDNIDQRNRSKLTNILGALDFGD